jgi:hypothetical protein
VFIIPDWISGNVVWGLLLVAFIIGVGILWPMSDAQIKLKPGKLRLVDASDIASRLDFTVQEAAFHWIGYERPAADAQVVAWLTSHPPLELVHSRLSKLAVEGRDGSFYLENSPVPEDPEAPARGYAFSRADLERYAKRRSSLHGEPIPAFLAPAVQLEAPVEQDLPPEEA